MEAPGLFSARRSPPSLALGNACEAPDGSVPVTAAEANVHRFRCIQYSERFWRPISDLSEKFNILQVAMASSERIFTLLDTRPELAAPVRPASLRGEVAFEDVWFGYGAAADGAEPNWVLRDVEFRVEPGRSVALVGATGGVIQDALRVLLRGRIAIVIAHRLSTIQNVDEILVLHKGRIRERGAHQALLAQRGIYWRLYQLQYKDQELRALGPAESPAPEPRLYCRVAE